MCTHTFLSDLSNTGWPDFNVPLEVRGLVQNVNNQHDNNCYDNKSGHLSSVLSVADAGEALPTHFSRESHDNCGRRILLSSFYR